MHTTCMCAGSHLLTIPTLRGRSPSLDPCSLLCWSSSSRMSCISCSTLRSLPLTEGAGLRAPWPSVAPAKTSSKLASAVGPVYPVPWNPLWILPGPCLALFTPLREVFPCQIPGQFPNVAIYLLHV